MDEYSNVEPVPPELAERVLKTYAEMKRDLVPADPLMGFRDDTPLGDDPLFVEAPTEPPHIRIGQGDFVHDRYLGTMPQPGEGVKIDGERTLAAVLLAAVVVAIVTGLLSGL